MKIDIIKRGFQSKLLLISLAIMLLSLALPIALLQIYDRILPNQGVGTAWVLTLGVLTALALEVGLRYGRSWLLGRESMKWEAGSQLQAMQGLLQAPAQTLRQMDRVQIEQGFDSLKRLQEYASGQALLAMYDAPFILLFLAMVAYVGGNVVWIPVLVLVIAFVTVFAMGTKTMKYAQDVEEQAEPRALWIERVFSQFMPVKALALEGVANARFDRMQRQLSAKRAGLDEYLMRIQLLTTFFSQATTILVVLFSAHLVISGDMSSGALAACTLLAGRTMAPVGALFSFWGRYQSSDYAQDRATGLLALAQNNQNALFAADGEPASLEVKGLQLPGSEQALSFEVKAGALLRLPEPGRMRWDGFLDALDGKQSVKADIRANAEAFDATKLNVVRVESCPFLFEASVLENLTLFCTSREASAYEWATKLGLHERVIQLPNGYHTTVGGTRGTGLDRGTQQLLGIVRALCCKPQLLILDHADTDLDMPAQKLLLELLPAISEQTSCLVRSSNAAIKEVVPALDLALEEAK